VRGRKHGGSRNGGGSLKVRDVQPLRGRRPMGIDGTARHPREELPFHVSEVDDRDDQDCTTRTKAEVLAILPGKDPGNVCCKWRYSMRTPDDPEYVTGADPVPPPQPVRADSWGPGLVHGL